MPTMSSACPVKVVPSTAATPIVFSSTCGSTSSGPIVYLPAAAARSAARRRSSGRTSPTRRARRRRRPGSAGRSACRRPAAVAPVPLQRQRAEHDRLGRALRACAGGLARRVEEVGEHPDAALLDLGGLRVLGVVDEVAVQVLGDDPLRLRLHPRGDEGGEIARRVAVEDELLADQAHRIGRRHAGPGKFVLGTSSVTKRLPNGRRGVGRESLVMRFSLVAAVELMTRTGRAWPGGLQRRGSRREQQGGADEEAHGTERGPGDGDRGADRLLGARAARSCDRRGHEQHRPEHVDPRDPPRQGSARGGSPARRRGCRRRSPRGSRSSRTRPASRRRGRTGRR